MRVYVTKPVKGLVDIHIDDRRGLTGVNKRFHGVKVDEVGLVVTGGLVEYEERLEAVRRARREPLP